MNRRFPSFLLAAAGAVAWVALTAAGVAVALALFGCGCPR